MERITTGLPDGITERYHLKPGDALTEQIISAYAPSATPHAEYPTGLPFLPDTVTYVTIHPGGEAPPGARWQTADADAAAAQVIALSRADGWTDPAADDRVVTAVNRAIPARPGVVSTYLRKGSILRTIIVVKIAGQNMLQLLDARDPA